VKGQDLRRFNRIALREFELTSEKEVNVGTEE